MPTKVSSNAFVSQAILDAMATGRGAAPNINSQEWAAIKKVALGQLRSAAKPQTEFKKIVQSFAHMDKLLGDKAADRTEQFVEGALSKALEDRKAEVGRGPSVRHWSGYSGYRGRS